MKTHILFMAVLLLAAKIPSDVQAGLHVTVSRATFNGSNAGTIQVDVTNTGGSPQALQNYQVALVFTGEVTSISLGPLSGVLSPVGSGGMTTPDAIVFPPSPSERVAVGSLNLGPSIMLPAGTTTLFSVPYTLLGSGNAFVQVDGEHIGAAVDNLTLLEDLTNPIGTVTPTGLGGAVALGAVVPEPSSLLYLSIFFGLGWWSRRNRTLRSDLAGGSRARGRHVPRRGVHGLP